MLNPGPTGCALSLLLTVRPTLSSAQSRILTEIGSNICPPSPSSVATRLEDGEPNNSMIPSRFPLDSSRSRFPCGSEIVRENFH